MALTTVPGTTEFAYCDDLGPEKIVQVYEPSCGLRAVVVVDNTARGAAIGGVRMAPDVTVEECFRLARAMTLKNAAAGLAHGGGKSVIVASPRAPAAEKERLLRAFARAIERLTEYIVGPDMGTDEASMGIIHGEIGRAVGLPEELGGIPLDKLGTTGWGLAAAIDEAKKFCGIDLQGARVVIQGTGAVGLHAARFLAEKGCVLVGAADTQGSIHQPQGLDIERLRRLKQDGKSVVDYGDGQRGVADAVLDMPCEVWIPAARPDVLTAGNVARLRTRLVAQGANVPATAEAEELMHRRGILVLPDFLANAGGVICAAVEYHGGSEAQAFATIEQRIRANIKEMLALVERGQLPRHAALELARARLTRAMALRRHF